MLWIVCCHYITHAKKGLKQSSLPWSKTSGKFVEDLVQVACGAATCEGFKHIKNYIFKWFRGLYGKSKVEIAT